MPKDASAPPLRPPSHKGSITIQYVYREEDQEVLAWDYRPDPPIPDELAVRLLREVADRL
jgi:anti-sigma regulatory factor (Ser/Thr protein kinase)